MASSIEDTANQMYECELARIDAERRASRKRVMRVLIRVAAVLFVVSGIILSNGGHSTEWQMVDPPVSVMIAISVLLGGTTTVWLIVRRAKDLDVLEGALFLVAGLVFASGSFGVVGFGYFSAANAWFDDSAPEPHRVKVHERVRKRGVKSLSARPQLVVESWRPGRTRETLYVPDAVFDADPGTVIVTTRAGCFGYTWIANIAAGSP